MKRIETGSSPNSANRSGQTALHVAALWGSMRCGAYLIASGAKINFKNGSMGMTPLMFAASRGKKDFAEMLLKNGADKQMVDNEGYRALDHLDDFEDEEQEDEEEGAVGIKGLLYLTQEKAKDTAKDRAKFMAEFRAMLSVPVDARFSGLKPGHPAPSYIQ